MYCSGMILTQVDQRPEVKDASLYRDGLLTFCPVEKTITVSVLVASLAAVPKNEYTILPTNPVLV